MRGAAVPVQTGTAPVVSPSASVTRETLLDALDRSADARVICLSAPGGFGKSTLLAQWAGRQHRRVVWLTVPVGTDAVALAERLAVELSDPSSAPLPVVHDRALWFSVVLPSLERLVRGQSPPYVIVLDDAMNLADPMADTLLSAMVNALPQGSQVVLATREGPPQAVRRLRSTGRTLELGAADLTLSPDEAYLLLDELGVHLPEEQRARVVQVTEGWPVGVYLLGRAILSTPELVVDDAPSAWAPSWISDYIRDELFDALAPDDADFLMDVSVLDELRGPVCDAVSRTTGSLARLRRLAVSNQLIGSGAGEGETFRLHQMFSDFLRNELRARSSDRFHAAHRAAAEWFSDAGQIDEAVVHARECADDEYLGGLVWEHAGLLLAAGKVAVVRRFVAGISEERIENECGLALTAAWLAAHEGDIERLTSITDLVTRGTSSHVPSGRYPYDVAILDSFMGRGGLHGMVDSASRAIGGLPSGEPWLTVAHYLRASAELLLGLEAEAVADLGACRELARVVPVPHLLAFSLGTEAQLALHGGDLDLAVRLADEAAATLDRHQLQYMPSGAVIQIALAQVHLAAGRRREAREEADRALRLTALIGPSIPWFALQGRLLLAQLFLHLGERRQARVLLDEARDLDRTLFASPVLESLLLETEQAVVASDSPEQGISLTTAELRVLQYLPTHLTFPEIAETLYLSRHTVKTQAISVYRKLGVSSRGAAVDRARQQGLLPQI